MTETLVQQLTTQCPKEMRLFQQERTILEATELICEMMESEDLNRSDLAKRLGKSKSHVSQLLDGKKNMTLRTISDMFTAMNRTIHFSCKRMNTYDNECTPYTLCTTTAWPQRSTHEIRVRTENNVLEPNTRTGLGMVA
jgi:plasmid maintenance system antidote protein VapI